MSAEIINFPRPFQPPREQSCDELIDEIVRIISKCDKRKRGKRKRGKEAIRASVLGVVADIQASIRASRERGEG
jgi:predicted site-specific integrase-resolvase